MKAYFDIDIGHLRTHDEDFVVKYRWTVKTPCQQGVLI
jgi:hypothetical protein